MPNNTLSDVFGMSRSLPLNYTERDSVDNQLLNSLTRDEHLVIYGSSKQGKTSLRKHCLNRDDYIVVHCSNKWSLGTLHESILKKAGYEITQSKLKATSGKYKVSAQVKAGFVGVGAQGALVGEHGRKEEESIKPLDIDSMDVNDIISALQGIRFDRFIVLEDFHYLPTETQKDFSVALKAFHENSKLSFIIVGVWLEENRLSVYNGDLVGRLLPINADRWTREELLDVVAKGEELLNIYFNEGFKKQLLSSCYDSVHIVQEVCRQCCLQEGVNASQRKTIEVGATANCDQLVTKVVNTHRGRFNSFLVQFAEGFQDTELEMYKWLLYPVIVSDSSQIEKGFKLSEIRKTLANVHPRKKDLNSGNVTQSLKSTTSLQIKKDIKPIVLDYDETNLRLNIVDKSFQIWLSRQEKNDLLDLVGLPKL